MTHIKLSYDNILPFVGNNLFNRYKDKILLNHKRLHEEKRGGNLFWNGWLKGIKSSGIKEIQKIREQSDVLLVIGIGGSYLGSHAAISLLENKDYTINMVLKSGTTTELQLHLEFLGIF